MEQNKEIITGGDFKRMVMGAYSEFLLDYEEIDKLKGMGHLPGTHVLRTMGSAMRPLQETDDDSISGISHRIAVSTVFGARGDAGVVIAMLFQGIGKGLLGRYYATSTQFGKAFQYGILYVQRTMPAKIEKPVVTMAKAVAKGAYQAVRSDLPISEILSAAIEAGEAAMHSIANDAGARIMLTFLRGCRNGLSGNFVSTAVSLAPTRSPEQFVPNATADSVHPYCVTFSIKNYQADAAGLEKHLRETSSYVSVLRTATGVDVHLHTDYPGRAMEKAIGWGPVSNINITDMSERHGISAVRAIMPLAVLAVAANQEQATRLQEAGATVIIFGSNEMCPSVGELVNAVHSDLAAKYVMTTNSKEFRRTYRQARYILGERIELVSLPNEEAQERAIKAFDPTLSASDNAANMRKAAIANG